MSTQRIKGVLFVLAAGLLLGLAGCQAGEEPAAERAQSAAPPAGLPDCHGDDVLAFETIERTERGWGTSGGELEAPVVLVAADASQAVSMLEISEAARQRLIELDYAQYLALAVYRGLKPTTGYKVDIQCITREGSRVTIHVNFTYPKGGSDAITYPYHLVRVERDGLRGEIEFVLYIYRVFTIP